MTTTTENNNSDDDDNNNDTTTTTIIILSKKKHLLDWSNKQRRILTSNGTADIYYTAERGFPYTSTELPHYYIQQQAQAQVQHRQQQQAQQQHLQQQQHEEEEERKNVRNVDEAVVASLLTTHQVFEQWRNQQQLEQQQQPSTIIVGVWKRLLLGGDSYEHTTHDGNDEIVYNVQAYTLFIDIRIPLYTRKNRLLLFVFNDANNGGTTTDGVVVQSVDDMNLQQLQYYSRQHIFAGYSQLRWKKKKKKKEKENTTTNNTNKKPATKATTTNENSSSNNNNNNINQSSSTVLVGVHDDDGVTKDLGYDVCCTRHHCIDWNYVGIGRTRPNKWYIEFGAGTGTDNNNNNSSTAADDDDDNQPSPSAPPPPEKKRKHKKQKPAREKRIWNEYSYATNHHGQHYYFETWESYSTNKNDEDDEDDDDPIVLVLRMKENKNNLDGIIIVMNDHFNYCLSDNQAIHHTLIQRKMESDMKYQNLTSKSDVIDAAIATGDIQTAKDWLKTIQGGHGRIVINHHHHNNNYIHNSYQETTIATARSPTTTSSLTGWVLDTCIEFWKEGTRLFVPSDIQVHGTTIHDCTIRWNTTTAAAATSTTTEWYIFESSHHIDTIDRVKEIMHAGNK